jgi:hemerythrin-like domain-containing protein
MKITEALLAEHLVFHSIFDHVERTAPKMKTLAEIKTVTALLEAILKAHSQTEDDLFIGPLEHCFEQIGQRETFHQEHEEIDGDLALVRKAKTTRAARSLLLSVIAGCRKHFDKEERIVFPLAERVLSANTLSSLGRTWMDQRTHVMDEE